MTLIRVDLEKPHSLDVVSFVQGESMINTGWKNQEIPWSHIDTDPFILDVFWDASAGQYHGSTLIQSERLTANVKVASTFEDVTDLLVFV
jgi:hypothetical protein